MNKKWRLIEIVLSVILIVAGVLLIAMSVNTKYRSLEIVVEHSNVTWNDISWFKFFMAIQFQLILGLLLIISGAQLLRSKTSGWIMSIGALITLTTLPVFVVFIDGRTIEYFLDGPSDYLSLGVWTLVNSAFIVILVLKPFRKKYQVDLRSWAWVGGIFLFFLLNKVIF